jgi:glycosyltransferase involved in cell wall biosynthesis
MHTRVLDDSISLLVEPVDSEMAAGILRLAGDEQLRADLGQRARQRVAGAYDREAYRRNLSAFFTTLSRQLTPE